MSTIARTAAGTPVASTTTGRSAGPRPVARVGDDLARRSVQTQRLALRASRLQLEPALLEVDHEHLGAALARDQRRRTARSGRRPSTTTCSPARDPRRGGRRARRSTPARPSPRRAASAASIGKTCSCPIRSSSCRPPSTWIPISSKLSHVFGPPDAARVAVRRTRAAATARPAGRPRARRGNPGPSGRDRRADLVPLDAGELRAAGGVGQLAERRSGSPSRRSRPPPGARSTSPGPGSGGLGPIGDHHRPDAAP